MILAFSLESAMPAASTEGSPDVDGAVRHLAQHPCPQRLPRGAQPDAHGGPSGSTASGGSEAVHASKRSTLSSAEMTR